MLRRAVIASVLTTTRPRTTLFELTYRSGSRLNVVRADDLASLADLYIASAVNERAAIERAYQLGLRRWARRARRPGARNGGRRPARVDVVHAWVDPIALDSPEAEQGRQLLAEFRSLQDADTDDTEHSDDIDEQIHELLGRFDNGEAFGFWQTTRPPDRGSWFGALRRRVWTPILRRCCVGNAVRGASRPHRRRRRDYLCSQPCEPNEWLRMPRIRLRPADAGYPAMILSLRVAIERLLRLPLRRGSSGRPYLRAGHSSAQWRNMEGQGCPVRARASCGLQRRRSDCSSMSTLQSWPACALTRNT